MFTAVTVPSLLFFAGALFVPESPRWLLASGAREKARRVLARIGGEDYAAASRPRSSGRWARGTADRRSWKALLEPGCRPSCSSA